jgi:hypothetical protein
MLHPQNMIPRRRKGRTPFMWLSAALVAAAVLGGLAVSGQSAIRLASLEGRLHDPLARQADTRVIVLLFLSVDCPISNRYAPEINRLRDRFSAAGVEFRLIYPNAYDSPGAIQKHLKDFGHRGLVLRDPGHALVKHAQATVTPEAVAYGPTGRVAYRGRIDDRFVSLAAQRPTATRHDLADAITATLSGKAVIPDSTPAVGCYIADFGR